MDAPLPHTRGVRDSVTRQVCSSCLGLEHAIDNPGSCGHCVRFTVKSLHLRLARQASLSEQDPPMSTDPPAGSQDMGASATESEPLSVSVWGSLSAMPIEPESRDLAGRDPVTARHAGTVSRAPPSWGSRIDLTMVSPAEDVLGLDYEDDEEEDALAFLLSESDEQEENTFMSPAQAAKPEASAALPGDSAPASLV
ncbi:hypothetical protein CesoFtcFv8_010064 [Champsocephalus esox]|uniref:Uncharacterized protein n=1 Tax=Champsocephalus esox TaxID=159716 RepID=A0AAN8C6S1_9TELE|nr:hypothetical protein CesoFtcFv8_010064 [Champsocephalus esox]